MGKFFVDREGQLVRKFVGPMDLATRASVLAEMRSELGGRGKRAGPHNAGRPDATR